MGHNSCVGACMALLVLVAALQCVSGKHVLVIGTGVNGVSTASFLDELGGDYSFTFAEAGSKIGGRVANIKNVGGTTCHLSQKQCRETITELGASVYHTVNRYMVSFAAKQGLNATHPYRNTRIGLWNGESFAFQTYNWKILSIASALYNYGLSPIYANQCIDAMVSKLDAVYAMQEDNNRPAFKTAEELLEALGLRRLTLLGAVDFFEKECGVGKEFITEMVHAMGRLNYGQGLELSAFAAAVAMKGNPDEVVGVQGGNDILLAGVIHNLRGQGAKGTSSSQRGKSEKSQAPVQFNTNVRFERNRDDECYNVFVNDVVDNRFLAGIDAVVVAHNGDIGADLAPPVTMHRTVATIVRGQLNATNFGVADESDLPTIIGTTLGARVTPFARSTTPVFFRSIGRLGSGNGMFKVFSDEVPSVEQLRTAFHPGVEILHVQDWTAAYPKLTPAESKAVEGRPHNYRLISPGSAKLCADTSTQNDKKAAMPPVYHSAALEYAISTLETQAISAKNAALLIHADLAKSATPTKPIAEPQPAGDSEL